ncbi:hypothetical protein H4Q26_017656 [Puccinia striiformis f. sp. tritici PST-130]|nr:hypothetical protein H4Q26_017656 [Puccinia striiformis f. sp. tritici PST-130]
MLPIFSDDTYIPAQAEEIPEVEGEEEMQDVEEEERELNAITDELRSRRERSQSIIRSEEEDQDREDGEELVARKEIVGGSMPGT